MFPLVDQLLEQARVRVLWDEARAQQLEPLARDLRDDRRIVQKPPATKRHQVVELSRRHTQLVLILARKKRRQKLHVRILSTNSFDARQISFANAVASLAQVRVNTPGHSDHQRQRQTMRLRRRQNNFAQQTLARVRSRKLEIS